MWKGEGRCTQCRGVDTQLQPPSQANQIKSIKNEKRIVCYSSHYKQLSADIKGLDGGNR